MNKRLDYPPIFLDTQGDDSHLLRKLMQLRVKKEEVKDVKPCT